MRVDISGLSAAEADRRRAKGQANSEQIRHGKPTTEILLENLLSVFNVINAVLIAMLLGVYFAVDDIRLLLDSVGVITVVIANTAIAVYQEFRARSLLERARLTLTKEITVVRDSVLQKIPQNEVVEGDVILIRRGDYAVADGAAIESHGLEMNESLLTGESLPVEKKADDTILSGSFCVAGSGYYRAQRVGKESYASGIVEMAQKYKFVNTPLQVNINRIFEISFAIALLLAFAEVMIRLPEDALEINFVRRVATMITSLAPEGLVFFSTISFAIGVYRVGKLGAVVQKLNAIESFSTIGIVCMDKTGTITQNAIALHDAVYVNERFERDDIERLLGSFAKCIGDDNPIARELRKFPAYATATAVEEIPFSSERKYSAARLNIGERHITLALGAYERLYERLDERGRRLVDEWHDQRNLHGFRTLLFVVAPLEDSLMPMRAGRKDIALEPLAIVAFSDPVRTDIDEALELFTRHNVQLKILSGDAPESVAATLRDAGWKTQPGSVVTGNELQNCSPEQLRSLATQKDVFARLSPLDKKNIIQALKHSGRTAMIGDGVNDVPAIKEADLGIAMEEGSSITREISDIVLLKNRFSLLPDVFLEGKRIIYIVLAIAKLFLTKNLMVLAMGLLTLGIGVEFPLTPRRAALLAVLGVALPSYCITVFDRKFRTADFFFRDLLGFISASLLALLGAGYGSLFIANTFFEPSAADRQMVMLSVLVVLSLGNYLYIALRGSDRNPRPFLLSAAIALVGYIVLVVFDFDFLPFYIIKTFYELHNIDPRLWSVALTGSSIGLVLLYGVHRLRERFFGRRGKEVVEPEQSAASER